MSILTFDSYAWIAYLAGKSEKVRKIVDSDILILTPSIVITEIKHKYQKEGHDYTERIKFIETRCIIIDISREIASKAAELKLKHKLYTIDALIYATAIIKGAQLFSGDKHFKDIPDVIFIKED